jgi:hypothetical protein
MRARAVPPLLLALAALGGCGGGDKAAPPATRTTAAAAHAQRLEAVVHEWSTRLDAGDNKGAAHLFALPAMIVQRPYAWRFPSYYDIALWHSTLPCAGRIVSVKVRGAVATVVFRLADRLASQCNAPGQLAAARFTIVRGKITRWEQIPVPRAAAAGPAA